MEDHATTLEKSVVIDGTEATAHGGSTAAEVPLPMDASIFYTPLESCLPELRRRVAEIGGREVLHRSHELAARLAAAEHMALFRQVTTPNFEFFRFLSLAQQAGLRPFLFQYSADKFTGHNHAKQALLKLGFHHGAGKLGGDKVQYLWIADNNEAEGRRLCEVRTYWGQPLMEFHEELLHATDPQHRAIPRYDTSAWYEELGGKLQGYYPPVFDLWVRHAVLCETHCTQGIDAVFTANVVLPIFHATWERNGLKPLIAALDPPEMEAAPYWEWYPARLQPLVEEKLRACGRLPRKLQYIYKE